MDETKKELTVEMLEEFIADVLFKPTKREMVAYTGIQGGIDFLEIEAKMFGLSEEEIKNLPSVNRLKELRDEGYNFTIKLSSKSKDKIN